MHGDGLQLLRPILLIWFILCLCPAATEAEAPAGTGYARNDSVGVLAPMVRELGLGVDSYVVGAYLTEEQVLKAEKSRRAEAYPGTFQFDQGDFVVVAAEKSRLILAVYQKREDIGDDELRRMVGYLIDRFGDPTVSAHGKLIYWAFGKSGKIDSQTYEEAKSGGMIDIIATVKFSSTLSLRQEPEVEEKELKGDIYTIISSNRLLAGYLSDL